MGIYTVITVTIRAIVTALAVDEVTIASGVTFLITVATISIDIISNFIARAAMATDITGLTSATTGATTADAIGTMAAGTNGISAITS